MFDFYQCRDVVLSTLTLESYSANGTDRPRTYRNETIGPAGLGLVGAPIVLPTGVKVAGIAQPIFPLMVVTDSSPIAGHLVRHGVNVVNATIDIVNAPLPGLRVDAGAVPLVRLTGTPQPEGPPAGVTTVGLFTPRNAKDLTPFVRVAYTDGSGIAQMVTTRTGLETFGLVAPGNFTGMAAFTTDVGSYFFVLDLEDSVKYVP
ncbi:MAG: hypothetical protein V4510_04140 [bacterium]